MTARPESGQSAESVLAEGEIKIRAALGKSVRADGGMVDLLAALYELDERPWASWTTAEH